MRLCLYNLVYPDKVKLVREKGNHSDYLLLEALMNIIFFIYTHNKLHLAA